MKRMVPLPRLLCMATVAACCTVLSLAQQGPKTAEPAQSSARKTGTLVIQLRDVKTGYGVRGTVRFAPMKASPSTADFQERRTNSNGKLVLRLPAGDYLLQETAPGYEPMKGHMDVAAGRSSSLGVMLDPKQAPEDEKNIEEMVRPGWALFIGYVLDSTTFRPIAGAHVRLQNGSSEVDTNERGFFALEIPARQKQVNELPDTATVLVQAPGYKTYILENTMVLENSYSGHRFELQRGKGTVEHDDTHKLMRPNADTSKDHQWNLTTAPPVAPSGYQDWVGSEGSSFTVGAGASADLSPTAPLAAIQLPTYITVGLNCTQTSCTSAQRLRLETYVSI